MKALILAGGKGTRLRPYTTVIPKPLMPVGQYPILEIILRQLRHAGVTEVMLAVGYLHHLFEAFFGDGRKFGMKISYALEEKPLGTAGAIGSAIDHLGGDFIVMNGDLLTTIDYRKLFAFHREQRAAATIGVFPREVKVDFGVIETTGTQSLGKYIEKPKYQFLVSMGVNVINSEGVRRFLDSGTYLDIPNLMTKLKEAGQLVACYREPCEWLDIGRVDDYQTANEIFDKDPSRFLPDTK